MTTVSPPPRSRPRPPVVVEPRARSRPRVPEPAVNPPPRRPSTSQGRENWVAAGVGRTLYKEAGYADPRLPVPVVLDPRYRKELSPTVRVVVEEYGKVRSGDRKWALPVYATPAFFYEYTLRTVLGWALMDDDCYLELEQHIIEHFDELNDTQKCITKIEDGKITVDLTTSVGPFYMESALQMEIHYKDKLRKVA